MPHSPRRHNGQTFSHVHGKFCDLTVNHLNKMTNDKLANKLRLAILALARIKLHCAAFPLCGAQPRDGEREK